MPRLDQLVPTCLAAANPIVMTLLILAPFVGIGLWAWLSWRSAKQRDAEWQRVAAEIGLPFYPNGDESLLSSLYHFHLFSSGSDGKIRNMLHGLSNDVEVAIFDFTYTIGSGEHATAHTQSVIYFRAPRLSLPHFALRPEGKLHKIGSALGFQDIDFDTHPQFSRQYLLQGGDETAVRSFFQPDLLTFFESQQQVCVEGGGDQMIFYRSAKWIQPAEVRDFMQQGFEVYSQFRRAIPQSNSG